jgi:aspartyl-tRNA synthetase
MMRSHRCGDLDAGIAGTQVVLCGWVHTRRDHGGVTFIDLRDTAGVCQVVFSPEISDGAHAAAQALSREYCVRVSGTVRRRPEGSTNPNIASGEIEVAAVAVEVLSEAQTTPFQIDDYHEVDEMLRLQYRYLDLRRESMQHNLKLRHRIISAIRRFFEAEGFVEVETPMLTRATPEGARDYLVPARLAPGRFYALPQSPQLFKQLLMVAGLDRYYQIARCFRDEDLRADRQPDFTQLDMEMSFVDVEDVLDVSERCLRHVWKEVLGVDLGPFPRLTYEDALQRFGSDKPDVRYRLELRDIGAVFATTDIKVFRSVLEAGGAVKAMCVPGRASAGRKELDGLVEEARSLGAKGLVWAAVTSDGLRSPLDKFFSSDERAALIAATEAAEGDLILIVADADRRVVLKVLGALRTRVAERYDLVPARPASDADAWKFVWITDFPWFEWDDEAGRWGAIHHPFTGMTEATIDYLESDPARVMSKAYDITLNGWELASGSIRIHDRATQQRVFRALGISEEEAQERFGFLLDAFRFGVPPHGGIAPGIDRIAALAAGEGNIREVIAFPKTQSGSDPLTGAPAPVDPDQLRALHIRSTAAPG